MKKDRNLTKDSLTAFLDWLDPDPNVAAQKYEQVRTRLIKIFVCDGYYDAERLADETIDRVASKISELGTEFIPKFEEKLRYMFGFAKNIRHEEDRRRKKPPTPPPPSHDSEEIERTYACLESCMKLLTPDNRNLVLEYYQEEKRAKIDHRKQLAEKLKISLNALRIRASRIRDWLEKCVKDCLCEATA